MFNWIWLRWSSNICLHTGQAENPDSVGPVRLDISAAQSISEGLENSWRAIDLQSTLENWRMWMSMRGSLSN